MLDIIIVEDNHEIGELLSDFLRNENYIVSVAKDGEAALELFERYGAKLVILDLMLPGMDGFAVCSKIRETSNAHILIVSAKTEKNDKLKGLNLGADDYIEKPYDMDILLAKIHGIFKRKYAQEELISGTIRLNTATQTIYVADQKVDSTAKEFELLKLLMENKGVTLKKEYSYRVDVARCVQELETGTPLEQIKLSDYPTLTRVSIFDAQEVCNEEYRVEEVQGKLYRFCYRRTVQYGSIWKLDLVLGALWICTAAFLILLGRKLVRPFASMEGLTTELAKGNLSVPIKAEKSRFFGKFLWSLDMLREKLEADKLRRLELEKEKKTLLLSLSHDIRTPLSAIELYTQALEENLYENEEKRQQAIGGIRKNTETIKKYVGEISEAAREDFLKLDVHQGEFYLSQMMQALKLYYKEKFADLHTDFQMESFADYLLYGDLDRAVEVGQNVLENAIKYGDGKYVHISFSEEEDHSLITIENSGAGLKEEELPHIFDAFYRGSNHAGVRGSGLGLYICKELLHKMDGDIYAKTPETGFAVTIVLRKM